MLRTTRFSTLLFALAGLGLAASLNQNSPTGTSGLLLIDKMGREVRFLDPSNFKEISSVEVGVAPHDFAISPDHKTAYIPVYGDGIYGRNTNPGHTIAVVDLVNRKVLGYLRFARRGMPQDIRISPDGSRFFVADMHADGVYVVDGDSFIQADFIPTGVGTHGLYPSRDGKELYVANRGSHSTRGAPRGRGSIAVIDFSTDKVERIWPIPGGGSPDMGNVSGDGKQLWLSGRFDNVVYDIDTTAGSVKTIGVDTEPHGLTVWPQPGRYSLGHTGNMR